MCEKCGCDDGHKHGCDSDATGANKTKIIDLETKVLSRNDEVAAVNRNWLKDKGITAINLISSPGTGKTLLLEKTLEYFKDKIPCAVIAGDQQTDNDARRLSGKGHKVVQIETVNSCHLDAERVHQAMHQVIDDNTKILFIENVGNLVCPSAYDLGETFKIALLSVTEGEDKPVKYPALFSKARLAILTKTDLLPHLDYDIVSCRDYLKKINPKVDILELSAKTGEGMDKWFDFLAKRDL